MAEKAFIKTRYAKTNKTQEVLKHLREHGSITSMEAFELFGATRLSAIIFTLRRKGYDIQTEEKVILDRYGHHCTYAEYHLIGEG